MDAEDHLPILDDLQQDLIALANSQLMNVERLWRNLEANIDAFRRLLDKPARREPSRLQVVSGIIEVDGERYAINDEFRQLTVQLAEALDLDELESARLLSLGTQVASSYLDRPPLQCAVFHFHRTRESLLQCLRLVLRESQAMECDEEVRAMLLQLVTLVLETNDGPARNGSLFLRRCIREMTGCETWLQNIMDQVQRFVIVGQSQDPVFTEMMNFQMGSLHHQHEALATIVTLLIKGGYAADADFYHAIEHMRTIDRWGEMTLHYVPILTTFTSQYGSSEGSANLRESRAINNKIMEGRDSQAWALPNLQAAMTTWWLAEYSGWYFDQPTGSPLQGVDLEAEAQNRSEAFVRALREGALQCTLSIVSQCQRSDWHNPEKMGLTRSLLGEGPVPSFESATMTAEFQELVKEQFENFTTAFITNMPDTLRRFKVEEDDQRRRILSGVQANLQNSTAEDNGHLEKFLLIMSYAYENRPEAAEAFWADPESNLYGFLQWASRRQSTPCISAFCEFFRAISTGQECSIAAQRFLLDENIVSASRHRRSISLSWTQIFEELELYASRIRDNTAVALPSHQMGVTKPKNVDIEEPESPVMLECYLRLIAHLCSQNQEIRLWILAHPTFRIVETLFALSLSTVPARVRACVYIVIHAILMEKDSDLGYYVWTILDHWASSSYPQSFQTSSGFRPVKVSSAAAAGEEITFETVASSYEEANAFMSMLHTLVSPSANTGRLNDVLQFPEQLGSSYRMPGIEPYVDLVLGKVFAELVPHLGDPPKTRILSLNVLNFIMECLTTFNEDLIFINNNSKDSLEETMRSSALTTYTRLHPFNRTMEWLFNDRVVTVLFALAHQNSLDVSRSMSESPLVVALTRSVQLMSKVLKLQATYLDIVRPFIKVSTIGGGQSVLDPALSSFEDSVSTNLHIVVDLAQYSGSGQTDLACASLVLLKQLCTSRKLNMLQPSHLGSQITENRLVGVLLHHEDLEPICMSLMEALTFDARELDLGSFAESYRVKLSVLDFLDATLSYSPEKPNVAHILLGFGCIGNSLMVEGDGPLAKGYSLLYSVRALVIGYPVSSEDSMLSWSLGLKRKGLQILRTLWNSSLTSAHTLTQLRDVQFLPEMWLQQSVINQSTRWSGISIRDGDILSNEDSVEALDCFLSQRRLLLELASTEIRLLNAEEASQRKRELMSMFLGVLSLPDGNVPTTTIFDLLDFLEIDVTDNSIRPDTRYVSASAPDIGIELASDGSVLAYNISMMEEVLELHHSTLLRSGRIADPAAEAEFDVEAQALLVHCTRQNRYKQLMRTRLFTLACWIDLATLMIEGNDADEAVRRTFILQALQTLSPKLEFYALQDRQEAVVIAKFAQTLLARLDTMKSTYSTDGGPRSDSGIRISNDKRLSDNLFLPDSESTRTGDVTNDRLFQLFRISLGAIQKTESNEILREALYNICLRYLAFDEINTDVIINRSQSMRVVTAEGGVLLDIVSDDGYSGEGTCRLAALLLLDALTELSYVEKTTYIVKALARTNYLVVLVESIKHIPRELRETDPADIHSLITYHEAKFSLLLAISQSRLGAMQVTNAGLFSSIRISGLFATDFDLGVDIDDPQATQKYYQLLLALLRIVVAVVISRGSQNEQTINQVRGFLTEYRPLMVAIFKRQANIGGLTSGMADNNRFLDELAELFVLLISLSGFVEHSTSTSDHCGVKPEPGRREQRLPSPAQSLDVFQTQKTITDLFAPSKHKSTESTTSSAHKRLKREHSTNTDAVVAFELEPMKAENMYTFSSTNTNGSTMVDLTQSSILSPRKNSVSQRRPINSVPPTGTKKLVVKNFRKTSKSNPDQYYDTIWEQLDKALSAIFHHETISLEELYRGVENLCRQEKAPALFQRLSDRCKDNVVENLRAPLVKAVSRGLTPTELLRAAIKAWTTWREQISTIRRIFYYMDRSYLLHSPSQPTIEELGRIMYRTHIFADAGLKHLILQGACDLIASDRKRDEIQMDAPLLREAIDMFHNLAVYTKEFEPKILGESQRYFKEWSQSQSSSSSLAGYVEECHDLIDRERMRCMVLNFEPTTEKDLTTQLDRFLIIDQEQILVDAGNVSDLMASDKLDSLGQLYTLLERKELGEKLRPPFEAFINQHGSEIVFDEAREAEMVVRLLQFKKKLDTMWEFSFAKHEGLGHSLREAFESFINKTKKSNMTWGTDNPKPGEMIAKYVDMILRGGSKAIPTNLSCTGDTSRIPNEDDVDEAVDDEDTVINRQLDQVLDMFRFVHGKAVFEAFYKKDLARRLLMQRSASADAEKNMLNRLSSECGSGFTHNLEQMFKDVELARDEMASYKQMLQDRQKKPPVDLTVNVLSASAWPTYPDVPVEVPIDIQKASADFEQHYRMKHTGRRLAWKHSLAHCQLKAAFPKKDKELVVSSFQAIVLLYFNDKDDEESIGYAELKAATSLSDEELKRTLQSLACAKYRVLTKSPKGKDVNETDTFSVNLKFEDPKYRIKINQVQLKETKEENKETHERVAADRHYETQAAIVRIMKSRKTIKHAELVAEVIKATKSRGVLDPADIKKNIEKLIEKDYMERNDGNVYEYLA
ncbi:hypothetical protein MMC26_003367 [Xylographa opegraphella]|nr:hypothetical protein [Xylographa opegraphella]